MRVQRNKSSSGKQIQKTLTPPIITEYADRLLARSEQKTKTAPSADAQNGETHCSGSHLVWIGVELQLMLEECQAHRYGLGSAVCVDGRNCARAIRLAMNRAHHALLQKVLAESDHPLTTYFAALLLGAFVVCNRRNPVVEALERKLKADSGHPSPAGWCPSHLAVADLLAASAPFARIATLPIYGPRATLGEVHILGTLRARIPEAAEKEGWNTKEPRKAPRKNTNEIKV
jgi:hypothetical protein